MRQDNDVDHRLKFLSSLPLFRDVPHDDLQNILPLIDVETFAAGEIILLEGETTNDLLILNMGTVEVYISRNGQKVHIVNLEPGSYFGEMCIFDDYPRSANVRAVSDVVAYRIERQGFRAFLRSNASALFQMCTVFSHRLRNANSALAKH